MDPYSVQEKDASFIEKAGELLSGERLTRFMAECRSGRKDRAGREAALEAVQRRRREEIAKPRCRVIRFRRSHNAPRPNRPDS